MTTTNDDLIAFVRDSERLQYTADEIAVELEKLGRIDTATWPRASVGEWMQQIHDVVALGQLERLDDGRIVTPRRPAPGRQLNLFD